MILSPHEIAWLALNVGHWTPEEATVMTAIALAESGGNTEALGRSKDSASESLGQRDHGLWQVSGRWFGGLMQVYRWRDPYDNARMARMVFDERARRLDHNGFGAWNVTITGAELQFMPDARWGVQAPWPPPPAQVGWRV